MKVKITDIKVPEKRQRQTYTKEGIDSLAVSLQTKGQLHPLTVVATQPGHPEFGWTLVSGFRRLIAARSLKWDEIEVKELTDLTPLEVEEIELDENLQRENLSWQEEVAAKKRIWEIRAELYGETVKEAAAHVGMSHGSLWEDARLAKVMEEVPELKQAKNKSQAMNKLRLLQRRMALEELASRGTKAIVQEGEDYSGRVLLGSCIEILKRFQDETIHCVVTDPPYGIELDAGQAKKGNPHPEVYHDDHYDIMETVALAAKEAYRVLVRDSHAYFWFDIKAYPRVYDMLSEIGFKVDPIPLVWTKNIPGQANHPASRWASGYEACFFCRKGDRALLKQGASNVLHYDVVPPHKKIHPTEKPTALLRQLIEASTVAGETVLDMFGGSGSTSEAALQTGRNFITMELDPAYHAGILQRLSKVKIAEPAVDEADGMEMSEDDEAAWDEALSAKGK